MVSGTPLFLGLFNNLAIFIVLVAVYGFLIDRFERTPWYQRQPSFGIVFGLFAISCMYIKIPVADGVIVDQRNAIVALSGAFGGPISAFISAVITGAYRFYLGGKGVTGGLIGVSLAASAGIGIYYFNRQKENFWHAAIASFFATAFILPGFLFLGDFRAGWELMKQMTVPYGGAVFIGILFVGLLLAREDRLHRAEISQKQSAERLRHFAESASDWFWEIDCDFRFIYVSDLYEEITGFKIADILNRRLWDIPGAVATPEEWASLRQYLMARKSFKDFEYSLAKEGENSLYVRIGGVPVFDADGLFAGYRGCATDFTKRKRAEEEREKLQDQLTQSQKMESVGRLAGGVAHDFNNMLGVIVGHSELALMKINSSNSLYHPLKEIQMAAERSSKLTRQLLAFARKQVVAPKVVDLNEAIKHMLNMLRRLIGENIELSWLPGDSLWPIKIDPSQIDQMIANLCVNARDAIQGVGKITIETENVSFDGDYCARHVDFIPGEYVRIAVSDTGCGIEKELMDRLFEPFFTTKNANKGTGLGLATVYGIVKQNQGFINVYSELGTGTSFTIYLTRHMDSSSIERTGGISVAAGGNGETILLVEDEIALLTLGKTLLEDLGYCVVAANSPSEALRLAEQYADRIHLLVTDVVMPEMNGRDLSLKLHSLYPHLKTLFTSGYTANVIAHHGVLDEGLHYLQKPFSHNDLAASVRKALDA